MLNKMKKVALVMMTVCAIFAGWLIWKTESERIENQQIATAYVNHEYKFVEGSEVTVEVTTVTNNSNYMGGEVMHFVVYVDGQPKLYLSASKTYMEKVAFNRGNS